MTQIALARWVVEPVPDLTATVDAGNPEIDPKCCNACATWLRAIQTRNVPPEVAAFLAGVGVDIRKPQEVWGAPDGGFLNGWYVFAGHLVTGKPGAMDGSFVELIPGFKCWLTDDLSIGAAEPYFEHPTLQFEFVWEGEALVRLERAAWEPTRRGWDV